MRIYAEVASEIGGGVDGAGDNGYCVEEEYSLEGFGAVKCLRAGVECGEEGVDYVEEVVGQESGVFG